MDTDIKIEYIKRDFVKIITDNAISNYIDFEKHVKQIDNTTTKGNVYEYFCKVFYEQIYVDDIDKYYMYSEIPNDLKVELNLSTNDDGIDAIALMKNGNIHSVQVKFRSNHKSSLSKRDVAMFCATSFVGKIYDKLTKCVIFTNCESINKQMYNEKLDSITRTLIIEKCDNTNFWDECKKITYDIPNNIGNNDIIIKQKIKKTVIIDMNDIIKIYKQLIEKYDNFCTLDKKIDLYKEHYYRKYKDGKIDSLDLCDYFELIDKEYKKQITSLLSEIKKIYKICIGNRNKFKNKLTSLRDQNIPVEFINYDEFKTYDNKLHNIINYISNYNYGLTNTFILCKALLAK